MKCLNCGRENDRLLCPDCTTAEVLEKIADEILRFKADDCGNSYLLEYVSSLPENHPVMDILPTILEYFDFEFSEYYYCLYFWRKKDARFESASIDYLHVHDIKNIQTQRVLYNLIDYYIRDDFEKPQEWCEMIADSEDLCCDLYVKAADYFAKIGEYDKADEIVDRTIRLCSDSMSRNFLVSSPENMIVQLNKQKSLISTYRTKKPYWPKTEERRRAVAVFYDARGIKYGRITDRPKKVPENEFTPPAEFSGNPPDDYCAFWCSEVFSVTASKDIYQIAGVKVRDGSVVDTFESLVRPWDSSETAKNAVAEEIGVPVEILKDTNKDVDIVMKQFFAFVEDDILVSTGAFTNQKKLLCRAARHTGMKTIENELYDLLEFAEDLFPEAEIPTRESLLKAFKISEGNTALEKAQANKVLFDKLKEYGD